ncbi:MAG: radical SAM protein [Verrucomicrobia bacterium]|nr:radical SAM protein [Verrucomicrobiota bacterium]
MSIFQQALRVFDSKPWVAHLYVTEQCNLDCHYCNEYDNSIPHPSVADLQKWMDHIRALGVARIGFQGGEPLKHPAIAELVRYAKSIGFCQVSMSTNGFLLTRELLADLEQAGLDKLQISVDRMTPIASTRKAMKSVLHKFDWFRNSKIRLQVSGVLFKETLDEMGQVIDTCLDLGIPVHARVIHDDLIHDRALRDPNGNEALLRFLEKQEELKRAGEKIHTSWNLFAYEKKMLLQEPVDWTCIAGYKYFFVSSRGKFWPCSQVRTEKDILEVTREDLLGYNKKKSCQAGCGVYCTAEASLAVSHPLRFGAREAAGAIGSRISRMQGGGAHRIRDFATTS